MKSARREKCGGMVWIVVMAQRVGGPHGPDDSLRIGWRLTRVWCGCRRLVLHGLLPRNLLRLRRSYASGAVTERGSGSGLGPRFKTCVGQGRVRTQEEAAASMALNQGFT